jgi:8-oxo-dGTP pyrophosphatase MutT (NUDIX family)
MYITIHQSEGPKIIQSVEEFDAFKKDKMIIEAAGGLVFNEKEDLLMIYRRGHWDLPKGKVDEGESLEECAIREVSEETGLQNLTLIKKLHTTYHTYHMNGIHVLKPSHWFLISHKGNEPLVPQTEEDITEIKWMSKEKAQSLVDKAYHSIKEMIERYCIDA